MKRALAISEAESLVMKQLWDNSPLAAEDVLALLGEQQEWQEATVKTLLNRLLKKGAVKAAKEGRKILYAPVLKREDWVLSVSKRFLDRMFDGRIAPLVAHFGKHGKLNKKDMEELKRLIAEMENGK